MRGEAACWRCVEILVLKGKQGRSYLLYAVALLIRDRVRHKLQTSFQQEASLLHA